MRTHGDRRRGVRRRGRVADDGRRRRRRRARDRRSPPGLRVGRLARSRRRSRRPCGKRATTPRSANPTSGTALASPADVDGVGAGRPRPVARGAARGADRREGADRARPRSARRRPRDPRIRDVEAGGLRRRAVPRPRSSTRSVSRRQTRRTTVLRVVGRARRRRLGHADRLRLRRRSLARRPRPRVDPARRRRPRVPPARRRSRSPAGASR